MNPNWSIDHLQKVWQQVSRWHKGQTYGGQAAGEKVEYLNHIGSVTFEVLAAIQQTPNLDADLALSCALLHDSIEDTAQDYTSIEAAFGTAIANGVAALTKNDSLSNKKAKMLDSLERILQQPKEVWCVKLADRICNLYAPPYYWNLARKQAYVEEARLIHQTLKEGNVYLAERLAQKIEAYQVHLKE